jgi:hypothetical protein
MGTQMAADEGSPMNTERNGGWDRRGGHEYFQTVAGSGKPSAVIGGPSSAAICVSLFQMRKRDRFASDICGHRRAIGGHRRSIFRLRKQ